MYEKIIGIERSGKVFRVRKTENSTVTYMQNSVPMYEVDYTNSGVNKISGDRKTPIVMGEINEELLELQNFMLKFLFYNPAQGADPEELGILLSGTPHSETVKDINRKQCEDMELLLRKDFNINQIFLPHPEEGKKGHWVTLIKYFPQPSSSPSSTGTSTTDPQYYVFDSAGIIPAFGCSLGKKIIEKETGLKIDDLNTKDLQGKSDVCWLFTKEFINIASNCEDFLNLHINLKEIVGETINKVRSTFDTGVKVACPNPIDFDTARDHGYGREVVRTSSKRKGKGVEIEKNEYLEIKNNVSLLQENDSREKEKEYGKRKDDLYIRGQEEEKKEENNKKEYIAKKLRNKSKKQIKSIQHTEKRIKDIRKNYTPQFMGIRGVAEHQERLERVRKIRKEREEQIHICP